jgi:hypothetical protein
MQANGVALLVAVVCLGITIAVKSWIEIRRDSKSRNKRIIDQINRNFEWKK